MHGLLSFFKHVFTDFELGDKETIGEQKFQMWKVFFKDLLATSLDISKVCANLLSNNRITDEGEAEAVDCRGHPIIAKLAPENQEPGAFEDFENLVLVGVWLAVKENSETLQRLIKWSGLPNDPSDQTKFLVDEDVHYLGDCFLEMLLSFKHRGALSITAETFECFVKELLMSEAYLELPKMMLEKALQRIQSENHSTILRRSAGIPPTIIAILRSEPVIIKRNRSTNKKKGLDVLKSEETLLLNRTLDFLLE